MAKTFSTIHIMTENSKHLVSKNFHFFETNKDVHAILFLGLSFASSFIKFGCISLQYTLYISFFKFQFFCHFTMPLKNGILEVRINGFAIV